jgi:hypothetical protein
MAEVECEFILETLTSKHGSRTNAARVLGISIRTLRNKIREYSARGKVVPEAWAPVVPIRARCNNGRTADYIP